MSHVPPFEISSSELELQARVGSGCTAEVFRALYRGSTVAVKVIDWNKSKMGLKEQLAFDREVAIMPGLKHPTLVNFIGVCSLDKPFRIVTEFCFGGCAFELLHNSDHIELSWMQNLKMCKDVAEAMCYLHQFNPPIIHRDLKSLNLLLAKEVKNASDVPYVKVSDFGLSRMKDQADGDGENGWGKMTIAAGTCHWMAPEVFRGEHYDQRADVYSYAMILFEIICREIPFEDEEPANVGRRACMGDRPDMDAVPPDCPKQLEQLMTHCWDANPPNRPMFDKILSVVGSIAR